jgi:hypothetical protein
MEIILKWIIGSALLLVGGWLMILNALVFWRRCVQKRVASSWIPFLGGLLAAAGLALIPLAGIHKWWWLPFFLDWGCLPGITFSIVHLFIAGLRK